MNEGSEGQETTQQVDTPAVEAPQGSPEAPTSGDSPGGHPAWESLYGAVSEDMVPILKPHLDEADRNVQKRFEALNEKYAPWQDVMGNADPDYATKAITYARFLEQNPQAVYEALKQQFGTTEEPAKEETVDPADALRNEGLDPDDPLAKRLLEQQQKLSEFEKFVQQQNAEREQAQAYITEQQQRELFENTMADLKDRYGEFDEMVVTAFLATGLEPDQAVLMYQQRYPNGSVGSGAPAGNSTLPPPVAGASGGLPAENVVNPGKLASQDVEDLVAKMLDQAQQG